MPEHKHSDFCLHLQIAGRPKFEWWCDGKSGMEMPGPGTLMLLPPGTLDRARWDGSSERFVISLSANFVKEFAKEFEVSATSDFQRRWSFQDAYLAALLKEIARESESGWALGTLYADSLSASLTTALISRQMTQPVSLPRIKGGISLRLLKVSLEFITDNLHRDIYLGEVASHTGLSRFHFARLFRNATGCTPHQYVLAQRVRQAKDLLRASRLSIAEVGARVGFINVSHFSRAFTQREGISPRSWRAAL